MALLADSLEGIFAADGVLAKTLSGFKARPSQLAYAKVVEEAIASGKTVALEAGTGTGKTYAYLIPALVSHKQVTITTASRTLQDQLFKKDAAILRKALNRTIEMAILKGRANYICLSRLEMTVKSDRLPEADSGAKLALIASFARSSDTGDIAEIGDVSEKDPLIPLVTSTNQNCMGRRCPHFEKCFVNRARQKAAEADIVIVNHHLYLSDVVLRMTGAQGLLPASDVIVFDEAHKVAEIASEYFSETLSLREIALAAEDMRRLGKTFFIKGDWDALHKAVAQALSELRDWLGAALGFADKADAELKDIEGIGKAGAEALSEVHEAFVTFSRTFEELESPQDENGLIEAAKAVASDIETRLAVWKLRLKESDGEQKLGDTRGILWVALTEKNAVFNLTPVSVAQSFRAFREKAPAAWVLTSATLSVKDGQGRPDFSYFLSELGLEDIAETHSWDSPFDFARQAFLCVPEDMPEPKSEDFAEALLARTLPLIAANPGKTFFLCTSFERMYAIADILERSLGEPGAVCLQGSVSREKLIEKFRATPRAVLVGSMSFWEGVDMKGEGLRLVVIDKLPFKPFDTPVERAKKTHLRELGKDPFASYQLPAMITTLRQGMGRLIRSEDDYGVVVVGDPRMLNPRYKKLVIASVPPMSRTRKVERACAFLADPEGAL